MPEQPSHPDLNTVEEAMEIVPQKWLCPVHGVVTENIQFDGIDPELDGLYCMACWATAIKASCHRITEITDEADHV